MDQNESAHSHRSHGNPTELSAHPPGAPTSRQCQRPVLAHGGCNTTKQMAYPRVIAASCRDVAAELRTSGCTAPSAAFDNVPRLPFPEVGFRSTTLAEVGSREMEVHMPEKRA